MKAEYNETIDALYLRFSDDSPSGVSDAGQGVKVHTTSSGRLVAIEVCQASKKLDIDSARTCSFQFQHDPNTFDFERALEGPWSQCHFEFERLEEYISALADHLPTVSDQYRLREERALNKNMTGMPDDVAADFLGYRGQQIDDAAELVIPMVAWNSALIVIWSAFERAAIKIAAYIQGREPTTLGYKDLYGSKLDQFIKYLNKASRIGIVVTPQTVGILRGIYLIRNFLAHENGNIADLPTEKKNTIKAMFKDKNMFAGWGGSVSDDEAIQIDEKFAKEALKRVRVALEFVEKRCAERYGTG